MVVGVARPHASVSVKREEATVLIAIDSSLSMSSQDVRPSRLAAAQSAAQAFVDGMPKKFRVGVIGFADVAVSHHEQVFLGDDGPVQIPMVTVVARKQASGDIG